MNGAIRTIPVDAAVGNLANMGLDPEFSIRYATKMNTAKVVFSHFPLYKCPWANAPIMN